ncbi:bactofilin family protein [Rhodospira trueperi]|uniref:Polymer-forming protein n=1 Tax=Rhodospira trueperi TaxID=69960 RepID=A0A1G7EJR6_9PROT|nr:polymer-forming cytoskeletal protein [Rhodospira trueperi]SDE63884.1 Polymer-forming protein [Rhodospira trueperi]
MNKSVFAADLHVSGEVTSKGDLDIFGHVEGSLDVRELVIARNASISGQITASSTTIAGRVEGHLDSDHVAIEGSGGMDGDVSYRTLSMVVGGALNARCTPREGSVSAARVEPTPKPGRARSSRLSGAVAPTTARQPVGASA